MPVNVTTGSQGDGGSTRSGVDTGTGGFPTEDGVRHTYDLGHEGDPEVPTVPWSSGDINVDNSKRDISSKTKATLGSYLSKTTLGRTPSSPSSVPNKYPVQHNDGEDVFIYSITDEKGYPRSPAPTREDQPHFVDLQQGRSLAATSLHVRRGREKPGDQKTVDGNDLLGKVTLKEETRDQKKISVIAGSSPISDYVSNSMVVNRFSSDKSYAHNNEISSAQFAKKYELGTSKTDRNVSFAQLAQVGNALTLRSTKELSSMSDGNNPTDGAAQAAALLPGVAQLGVTKINRDQLTAESVIETLTNEGIGNELLIDPAGQSWGSLNNVHDEFSGISAFGMQLLAVALLVAMAIIMLVMTQLFKLPMSTSTDTRVDETGRPAFGAFNYDKFGHDYSISGIISAMASGQFNMWRMIGVEPTYYPLEKCLPVGALAFFGVEDKSASAASFAVSAAKAIIPVTQSPGYYSIVARNVSRSYLQISAAFSSIGKAFSSGMTSGVKQLISVIDVLRSSKFIRMVDVFSHYGDRILSDKEGIDKDSKGSGARFISEIDRADNRAGGKGRLKLSNPKDKNSVSAITLSWASYRARDMFIKPTNFKKFVEGSKFLDKPMHETSVPLNYDGGLQTKLKSIEVERISSEDRENMENILDSEYVPFYFHDVRTNEIISFHAFLASLSDDYTANYDSADGIGRIEAVKIYKSTNRKIGFSFYIAATNPNDFDSMWLKINKLTTLVYPQFSEGRRISFNNNSVTMPFSQIIQAAPLVRIRIGDLIQSNYSKFGLARLFGLHSPDSQLEGKKISGDGDAQTVSRDIIVESFKEKVGNTFTLQPGCKLTKIGTTPTIPGVPAVPGTSNDTQIKDIPLREDLFQLKVAAAPNGDGEILCEVIEKPGLSAQGKLAVKDNEAAPAVGKKYLVKKNQMIPTDKTNKKIEVEIQDSNDAAVNAYFDAVSDFMDDKTADKGNAIVKSFRSSGGRGLAGFIDSIGFDWYDKVNWEIAKGRKAPKMCKVNISFTPIHDIAPGLDHLGVNRAPIYSVSGLNDYERSYINDGKKFFND